MITHELVFVCLIYIQPILLGLLLIAAVWVRLIDTVVLSGSLSLRRRLRSTRFFECAAYSRLIGWLRYGTQGLALCALFLLYDIDLVFFFTEVTYFDHWGWSHWLLFLTYIGFFFAGLAYDLWRCGFMWNN